MSLIADSEALIAMVVRSASNYRPKKSVFHMVSRLTLKGVEEEEEEEEGKKKKELLSVAINMKCQKIKAAVSESQT